MATAAPPSPIVIQRSQADCADYDADNDDNDHKEHLNNLEYGRAIASCHRSSL